MVELVTEEEEEESGAERSGRSQSVAVEEDGRTASSTMIETSAVGQLIKTSVFNSCFTAMISSLF